MRKEELAVTYHNVGRGSDTFTTDSGSVCFPVSVEPVSMEPQLWSLPVANSIHQQRNTLLKWTCLNCVRFTLKPGSLDTETPASQELIIHMAENGCVGYDSCDVERSQAHVIQHADLSWPVAAHMQRLGWIVPVQEFSSWTSFVLTEAASQILVPLQLQLSCRVICGVRSHLCFSPFSAAMVDTGCFVASN